MSHVSILVLDACVVLFWVVWLLGYVAMKRQWIPLTQSRFDKLFLVFGLVFVTLFLAKVLWELGILLTL
jgi:hypothetical protein